MTLDFEQFIPLLLVVCGAIVFMILERIYPYTKNQRLFRKQWWTDVLWFNIGFALLMGHLVNELIIPWFDAHTGLSQIAVLRTWPIWQQVLLSLFAHDLFIYVFHFAMHKNKYLWRLHECHHSVEEMDVFGGNRGQVFENTITGFAEFAPIILFMSPEVALIKPVIDAWWGMFIHANVDVKLGPLKYIINGPRMHRWHHSREVYDVNFATKFSFWDWMFGTAYLPDDKKSENLGLNEPFPGNIIVQQLWAFRPFSKAAPEAPVRGAATPGDAGFSPGGGTA